MKGNERLMADYGHWASALSAERVFAASETVSFVRASPHGAFFLLSMPEEGLNFEPGTSKPTLELLPNRPAGTCG